MAGDYIAKASTTIDASPEVVWNALVSPGAIRAYMFGAEVESDWQVGSAITWKGTWEGKPYEDRGTIRRIEPARRLEYSHWSPLSGVPDTPEHHHIVTIELTPHGPGTRVFLTQNRNATPEARDHSERNWARMLDALRRYVEHR